MKKKIGCYLKLFIESNTNTSIKANLIQKKINKN